MVMLGVLAQHRNQYFSDIVTAQPRIVAPCESGEFDGATYSDPKTTKAPNIETVLTVVLQYGAMSNQKVRHRSTIQRHILHPLEEDTNIALQFQK
jgi:hypothetical protein